MRIDICELFADSWWGKASVTALPRRGGQGELYWLLFSTVVLVSVISAPHAKPVMIRHSGRLSSSPRLFMMRLKNVCLLSKPLICFCLFVSTASFHDGGWTG